MNSINQKMPEPDQMESLLNQLQGIEQPFVLTLINLIPHPLFFLLSDGTFKECNTAFEKNIYGKEKESLFGKSFVDIQPILFAKKCNQFINRSLKTREGTCFEIPLQYTDFQVRQVSISIAPFYYENNECGLVGFINDVTLLNDYDFVVRTSEQKYRNLFEESNDAILIHDKQGQILDVNKLSVELFGYTKSEFLVLDIPALYPDIPDTTFTYNHSSGAYREQKLFRKKDGQLIYCDISSRPFDQSGNLIQAIIRDISSLKSIETALEQSLEEVRKKALEAEESNRLKDKFLSFISHEFEIPLNGIMSMTELLYQTSLNREQKEFIEILSRSSKDMVALINNTTDFSQLGNGTFSLNPKEIDLIESIESSINLLSVKAADKGLEFSFTIDTNLPAFVIADASRLMQVIENLASNAIKFTDTGSVHLGITQLYRDGLETTLQFKVSDTGRGIDLNKKDSLFNAFSQIDTSTTTRGGGTELGLMIAKHLVEMMNGCIDYESNPGEGSVFWFKVTLPISHLTELHPISKCKLSSIAVIDHDKTAFPILAQFFKYDSPKCTIVEYSSLTDMTSFSNFDLVIINDDNPDNTMLTYMHSKSNKTLIAKTTSKTTQLTHHNPLFNLVIARPFIRKTIIEQISGITRQKVLSEKQITFSLTDPYYLHVLVVDDNLINQKVAIKMLKHIGCTAEVANNGVDALSMLSYKRYDLILLDLQMPILDGFGVIKEIRNLSSQVLDHEVPVIAMTALSSQEDRKKCHDLGMNSFIVKPITSLELKNVIELSFKNLSSLITNTENDGAVS
jgi:PAS domain S-box-containing protein